MLALQNLDFIDLLIRLRLIIVEIVLLDEVGEQLELLEILELIFWLEHDLINQLLQVLEQSAPVRFIFRTHYVLNLFHWPF